MDHMERIPIEGDRVRYFDPAVGRPNAAFVAEVLVDSPGLLTLTVLGHDGTPIPTMAVPHKSMGQPGACWENL